MNVLLIVSAIAGFGSAIGHSYLGERFVLRPLFADPQGVLKVAATRRITRWVWHLPSFAWAQVAAATLWLALSPQALDANAQALLAYFGVGIYAAAAFFNALGLRRPHVGNILLSIAALTLWFGIYG
jgi:hypothetical protein